MAVAPECGQAQGDLASRPLPTKQGVGAGLRATAQSENMESPRCSLKTWPEGLLGPKICLEKQTNQPSLNQKEEWSNKSKLCLCT